MKYLSFIRSLNDFVMKIFEVVKIVIGIKLLWMLGIKIWYFVFFDYLINCEYL